MGSFSWRALLKPSLCWLLVFVPAALLVRYVPALRNETALFFISCLGIIPQPDPRPARRDAEGAPFDVRRRDTCTGLRTNLLVSNQSSRRNQ